MDMNIFTIMQTFNIAVLVLWPILSLLALVKLRSKEDFNDWIKVIWSLIIVVIPILGSVAFFIVVFTSQKITT